MNGEDYFKILKIYNSKKSEMSCFEFCELLGVDRTNTHTYNKFITILAPVSHITDDMHNLGAKKIIIDRRKFKVFIRATGYFKENGKSIEIMNRGICDY